ncbi:MAG: hypothetical protein ACP5NL_04725 [Thermoplasmata archaeon]
MMLKIPRKLVKPDIDIEKSAVKNGEEYQRSIELRKNGVFERV